MDRFSPFQPNLIRHCAVVIRVRPLFKISTGAYEPCGADTARGGHNMTHCHCSARSVLLEQLRNPSILEISQVIFSSSRCNAPISSSARRCKDPWGSHLRGFFTDLALLHANARPEEIPWKRIKVRSHDADACLLLS